jgi:hypothetical protein
MTSNIQCDICGEDKYESGLCPNCDKVICEDCEIRILHEGVLDVVCPNCNYSFGTSMIIDRSKENSNSKNMHNI